MIVCPSTRPRDQILGYQARPGPNPKSHTCPPQISMKFQICTFAVVFPFHSASNPNFNGYLSPCVLYIDISKKNNSYYRLAHCVTSSNSQFPVSNTAQETSISKNDGLQPHTTILGTLSPSMSAIYVLVRESKFPTQIKHSIIHAASLPGKRDEYLLTLSIIYK